MISKMKLMLTVAAAGALLCSPAVRAADPVRVGVVVALTGPFAPAGGDIRNGAMLAVERVNAQGGIKSLGGATLEVVFGDSHSTPANAGSEGDRLIDQSGVVMLAGASSSAETIPLSVAAERKGVPMMVINGQSEEITNRGFKWLWSLGVQDKDFTAAAIAGLKAAQTKIPELKRVVMAYGDNETGQAAGRAFRELMKAEKSFEIVGDVEYSARAQDFGPTVLKIKSTGAQMVVLNGALREVVAFSRAFDQYDFHPMLVTLGGGTADPKYGAQVGKSANGVFNATSFAVDLPRVQAVTAAYLEKYKMPMSTNAAQGYQTLRTIADILELAASTKPGAIATAIKAIKVPGDQLTTSSAFVEFEGPLNKGRRALLTQWQDGKLVTVWPADVAVGATVAPPVNTKN